MAVHDLSASFLMRASEPLGVLRGLRALQTNGTTALEACMYVTVFAFCSPYAGALRR